MKGQKAKAQKCTSDQFAISENGIISLTWNFIEISGCITSTYIYSYLAAFGHDNDDYSIYHILAVFEGFFALSIIKNFITEYTPENETVPVRKIRDIAHRYFSNGFWVDLFCLVPFQMVFSVFTEKSHLFYLIKALRIIKGIKIFNV